MNVKSCFRSPAQSQLQVLPKLNSHAFQLVKQCPSESSAAYVTIAIPVQSAMQVQAPMSLKLNHQSDTKVHIATEFSMTDGTVLCAMWITTALLNKI